MLVGLCMRIRVFISFALKYFVLIESTHANVCRVFQFNLSIISNDQLRNTRSMIVSIDKINLSIKSIGSHVIMLSDPLFTN